MKPEKSCLPAGFQVGSAGVAGRSSSLERTLSRLRLASILIVGVSGCANKAIVPEGGGAIYGRVEVKVLEDLDYYLPAQVRTAGVLLAIRGESDGDDREGYLQIASDRRGRFSQDGVKPGQYRIGTIRAPGRVDDVPGRKAIDVTFPLWESTLGVGMDGLEARRAARGELAEARFEVASGERRYIGDFVLELSRRPFEGPETCLTRSLLLPGPEGEAYLSSTPVYARLCAHQQAQSAPPVR